jgi:hypothetical protein
MHAGGDAHERDGARGRMSAQAGRGTRWLARPTDSYGWVLALIFLDYLASSALYSAPWGRPIIALLFGVTLLLTLHTSQAGRSLIVLALIFVAINLTLAVVTVLAPQSSRSSELVLAFGGFLLIIAPVVILCRIAAHTVVTIATIPGEIDVYLLFGMIFAMLFIGVDVLGRGPFFAGVHQVTSIDYLFFSYTTLTTVGYGNLIPAGAFGQTLAMTEALIGQIYLVIVVARLVSLWGMVRPKRDRATNEDQTPNRAAS